MEHRNSLLQEKAQVQTCAKDLEMKYRQQGEEMSSLEEQVSHINLKILRAQRTQRMKHAACESELVDLMRTCTRVGAHARDTLEYLPSHNMRDVQSRALILTHVYASSSSCVYTYVCCNIGAERSSYHAAAATC